MAAAVVTFALAWVLAPALPSIPAGPQLAYSSQLLDCERI
jgi:hypothetical protein